MNAGELPARSPRRDAQRNRELLVTTARETFSELGVDAPLDEIARRAGVGVGTLYRHFPTRSSLVEAIVAERVDEFLEVARVALTRADGWEALVGFLEGALALQTGDRVLREIFLRYPPGDGRLADARGQLAALLEELLERARSQGTLRPDFTVADLALLLWSFAPVIDATADCAPWAWRRHLHLVLDGLRASAATAPGEPPLDPAQLAEAMRCLRAHRFPPRPGPPRRGDQSGGADA